MRLCDLCDIQLGYTARSRLERATSGGRLAIQLGDLSPEGRIDVDSLSRFALPSVHGRYLVGAGDVLFRSRGERNTATAVGERLHEPALALLPLVILRPDARVVEPRFLAWAINQPPAQRQLADAARGTNIRMIPRSSLDHLDLDVPAIATQRAIVEASHLAEREAELATQLVARRRQLVDLALLDLVRQSRTTFARERKIQ